MDEDGGDVVMIPRLHARSGYSTGNCAGLSTGSDMRLKNPENHNFFLLPTPQNIILSARQRDICLSRHGESQIFTFTWGALFTCQGGWIGGREMDLGFFWSLQTDRQFLSQCPSRLEVGTTLAQCGLITSALLVQSLPKTARIGELVHLEAGFPFRESCCESPGMPPRRSAEGEGNRGKELHV